MNFFFLFFQHQVDVLCCPLSSQPRSSFSSDSEDEKESCSSSSISDSSSEGSAVSATDSSDPSSPVTCIPWGGGYPNLHDKESVNTSTSSKGETYDIEATACMDRKRKERHESSCSQEQDSKVIR